MRVGEGDSGGAQTAGGEGRQRARGPTAGGPGREGEGDPGGREQPQRLRPRQAKLRGAGPRLHGSWGRGASEPNEGLRCVRQVGGRPGVSGLRRRGGRVAQLASRCQGAGGERGAFGGAGSPAQSRGGGGPRTKI